MYFILHVTYLPTNLVYPIDLRILGMKSYTFNTQYLCGDYLKTIIVLHARFILTYFATRFNIFLARKCRVLVCKVETNAGALNFYKPNHNKVYRKRIPNTFLFCAELVSFGLFFFVIIYGRIFEILLSSLHGSGCFRYYLG